MINPYAPPNAVVSDVARESNAGRYVIAACFLLLAARDGLQLLFAIYNADFAASAGLKVGYQLGYFTLLVALATARFVAALAFSFRWRFAWWLGVSLVGYSLGGLFVAQGSPWFSILVSALPLLLLVAHFAPSVRRTFRIEGRRLLFGVVLLLAFAGVRAMILG